MMRGVVLLAVAALASFASAHTQKDDNVVRVSLAVVSGSVVKVTVKNTDRRRKIDFFQRGTILDENPVHKLNVSSEKGMLTPGNTA